MNGRKHERKFVVSPLWFLRRKRGRKELAEHQKRIWGERIWQRKAIPVSNEGANLEMKLALSTLKLIINASIVRISCKRIPLSVGSSVDRDSREISGFQKYSSYDHVFFALVFNMQKGFTNFE